MYKIDEIKMLRLGQRDENLARSLPFDCSDWLEQYPEASIHILFRRPGESAIVPMSTTLEGTTLTWLIHDFEVGKTGIGNAEFRAVDTAGLRRKSRIIPCSIEETLLGDDETVLYTQDQVDETLAHISEAAQAALAAKASEEAAALSAQEAADAAGSIGTAVEDTREYKEAAEQAARTAQTAQEGAEAAQSGVHADAEAAEQAKVAAQAAQAGAQGAASQASADRTAAETARTDAEAAATHAEAVVEGIDQAGADQVAAVNAAGQAQVTAVNQAGTTQVNAVQAKGTQVIASIPADYSALTNDVTDLKSAFSDLEDVVGEPNYKISSRLPLETTNGYYTIAGAYIANNSYLATKMSVTAGEMYAVSTAVQKSLNFALAVFLDADDGVVGYYKRSDATEIVVYADEIVKVPEGAAYMCITTLKASMNPMMIKNVTLISVSEIANDTQENLEGIFEHKNLINPDDIAIDIRYASTGKLVNDITNYAGTGMIPVEEGEMYTFSGTAMQALGGYYGEGAHMVVNETAIASVTFFAPVTGSGKVFTVPENQNIKYVTLVLKKANGEIDGTYQLEKGEMATEIVPYSDVTIKKSLLPASSVQPTTDIDSLPIPQYNSDYIKHIAKFRDHWAKKDKDLVVVGTGTSLTARGAEHCTSRGDAASRPPLMDSNNFASAMWDKMRWEGQQYRRYDYTGFFTETGTFLTSRNLSDWDDANYHDAWTRYSNDACSVAYTIPEDAWQVNFIYRTDQSGSETVTVAVAEGNGVMQVWNGTAWVEANGYTFSMRETPVILPSVSVPNPRGNEDNSNFTLNNYQISGNTTYQKRLKMKAVTRTASKTITISSSSGRFMYWGVEWSVREFMITYINSARGSHNMTVDSGNALQKYQDNEIWSHKPDLIFCENPIHNSGGSGSSNGFSSYYSSYWRNVTYDFFFNTETNPVSLMSRAIACGIDVTELEWCIFNSSISWNFGGIDNDGLLKIQPDRNGRMITALDAQMMSQDYLTETEKCVSINACKYWVEAAFKMFGNLKAATVGSGKDGSTFTNEGSHWNDTGCAIMARCIGGVFDFYN